MSSCRGSVSYKVLSKSPGFSPGEVQLSDAYSHLLRLSRSVCGKAMLFRQAPPFSAATPPIRRIKNNSRLTLLAAFRLVSMYQISRTSPVYYLTSVAQHRLPIFRTDKMKEVVCNALDEARRSAGFLIFAYVVMPDHLHLLTSNAKSTSETLRYTNGIVAKRVIDYLKENIFESCLEKLRIHVREREHKHSVFQHHPNAFEIYGEDKMMEKVNYIHMNPVRAELVKIPDDYRFSSSRQWHGRSLDEEPLWTDHGELVWRSK